MMHALCLAALVWYAPPGLAKDCNSSEYLSEFSKRAGIETAFVADGLAEADRTRIELVQETGQIEGCDKPRGLAHHRARLFIPGARLPELVAFARDYDAHSEVYQSLLKGSKVCARPSDNEFAFRYWSTPYRESITDTLSVHRQISPERYAVVSTLTAIGGASEAQKGTDLCAVSLGGVWYLTAMRSAFRFRDFEDGVYVESETVTVIPWFAPGFIINKVLRGAMKTTLETMQSRFSGAGAQRARSPISGARN
jgi:hypothetical protein